MEEVIGISWETMSKCFVQPDLLLTDFPTEHGSEAWECYV